MSKVYVRFGDLPEDGVSKIHKGDGIYEQKIKGISVWDCVFVDGIPFPILPRLEAQTSPQEYNKDALADYFRMLLGNRKIFLVTGDEVGTGYDGEPLITDVDIIREYTEDYEYLRKL